MDRLASTLPLAVPGVLLFRTASVVVLSRSLSNFLRAPRAAARLVSTASDSTAHLRLALSHQALRLPARSQCLRELLRRHQLHQLHLHLQLQTAPSQVHPAARRLRVLPPEAPAFLVCQPAAVWQAHPQDADILEGWIALLHPARFLFYLRRHLEARLAPP
jgi:hypothetical protein